jgi:hypothetical protein
MNEEYNPIPVLALLIFIPIDEADISKDELNRDNAKRILDYLSRAIEYYTNETLTETELAALKKSLNNKDLYCDFTTDYIDPDVKSDLK